MLRMFNYINFLLIIFIFHFVKTQNINPSENVRVESSKSDNEQRVIVTEKKLEEVAELREEIHRDIAEGKYAVGRPNEGEIVREADEYLKLRSRINGVLKSTQKSADYMSPYQNDESADDISRDSSISSEQSYSSDNSGIVPNVVESSVATGTKELVSNDQNLMADYIRQIDVNFERSQRESLILKGIKENLNFTLGLDVREWKITKNKNSKVLVGTKEDEIIFASKIDGKWRQTSNCQIGFEIKSFEILSHWNNTREYIEDFVLINLAEKILWIPIDNTCSILWEWNIGKPITGLRAFQIDNSQFLVVLTNRSNTIGDASVNIYQFVLPKKEFWITQMIPLENPSSEAAILDTGREIILTIAQINSVIIFAHNLHYSNNSQFQQISKIESQNLESVTTFQMGGISYVAISGIQPIILRYYHGKFIPQTVLGQGFGLVERFLPIPARTYRDDLILLVQHKIIYESHSISVLEALIWDGEAFQVSHSVPCQAGQFVFDIGVNCMIDFERNEGIKGAVVINDAEGQIAVITPREQAPSGYFEIEIGLVEGNNESEELERIHRDLSDAMKEYDSLIAESEAILSGENMWIGDVELETLITPELTFYGSIDNILVNENKWTDDDADIELNNLVSLIEDINNQLNEIDEDLTTFDIDPRAELFEKQFEILSRGKREAEFESLEYNEVFVENLFVENINDVPVEKVLFFNNDELHFNGTIVVNKNIDLPPNISVELDKLEIDGNLGVEIINGILWSDFINDIVITNIPNKLEALEIDGDIFALDELEIKSLNGLKFPDDFLWSSGPRTSIINAEKIFHNTLSSNAVDTEGLINGVNPFDLITLSDEQYVPGITTFTQLEVSENLEVNGSVSGKGLGDYLSNPSLLQTKIIEAACFFDRIDVRGPVIINGKFNETNLNAILNDIVYKTDQNVTITGVKRFESLQFTQPITVSDNSINKIDLNDFLTRNTNQELEITNFNGNILFNHLELNGLFNSVNVTELDRNSIKIDENRYNDATIILQNSPEDGDIQIKQLNVLEYLNGNPVNLYRTIYEDLHLTEAKFSNLEVENLITDSDITGNGMLNNLNLTELKTTQLDWMTNSPGDLVVDKVVFEDDLIVDSLNNIKTNGIIVMLQQFDNIPQMILSGAIQVDGINVKGNVDVNLLNEKHFNESILSSVVWLNRPNVFNANIHFLDSIIMQGDVHIKEYLNGNHFQTFLDDIVLKDEKSVVNSLKIFKHPVKIIGNVEVNYINNIPFSSIALKNRPIHLKGRLNIDGSLLAENLDVKDSINEYSTRSLKQFDAYDSNLGAYVIDEMSFNENTNIENLVLKGKFNEIENIDKFLKSLIFKNSSVHISGEKIFKNKLDFQNGMNIDSLNELNLNKFFKNVVHKNGQDKIEIYGPITFLGPIKATSIQVNQGLKTTNLMGCELNEWLKNGLRIDLPLEIEGPLIFTPEALKGNNLNAVFVNNRLMSDVITLHTPQNLSGNVMFSEVILTGNINVKGLVNGVKLNVERRNTLMIHGNQHITAPITIQSARVLKNLVTHAPVSEKNIKDAALLKENLILRSPISFKKLIARNVFTNDLISGINFEEWQQKALFSNSKDYQLIAPSWSVNDLHVQGDIIGSGFINGVHIDTISQKNNVSDAEISKKLNELKEKFEQQCLLLEKFLNEQLVLDTGHFQYFISSFVLYEEQPITYVDFLKDRGRTILLVNTGCYSNVYYWNSVVNKFEKFQRLETGIIKDIAKVHFDDDSLYLVTNSHHPIIECNRSGSNIWSLQDNGILHYASIGKPGLYSMIREDSGKIYLINEEINTILETDLNFSTNTSWELPINTETEYSYRFLPAEANLGIALSDGKRIVVLNPRQKIGKRKRRDSDDRQIYRHEIPLDNNEKTRVESLVGDELQKVELNKTSIEQQKRLKEIINNVVVGLIHELELIKTSEQSSRTAEDAEMEITDGEIDDILKELHKMGYTSNETDVANVEEMVAAKTKNTESHHHQVQMSFNSVKNSAKNIAAKLWNGIKQSRQVQDIIKHGKAMYKGIKSLMKSAQSNDNKDDDDDDGDDDAVTVDDKDDHRSRTANQENDQSSDKTIKIMANGIRNIANIIKTSQTKLQSRSNDDAVEEVVAEETLVGLEKSVKEIIEKLLSQQGMLFEDQFYVPENNYILSSENSNDHTTNGTKPSYTLSMEYVMCRARELSRKVFDYFNQNSDESNQSTTPAYHENSENTPETAAVKLKSTDHSSSTPLIPNSDEDIMNEPIIGIEIPEKGILSADNPYLPSRDSGEIVVLNVGSPKNRMSLIAVSEIKDHLITDKHDVIRIYYDIIEGSLFQSIFTFRPHSLTVLYAGDETILAFVEDQHLIRIFLYRGIEGFVEHTSLRLREQVERLTSVSLEAGFRGKCSKTFLVIATESQIQFHEAIFSRNCDVKSNRFHCTDW